MPGSAAGGVAHRVSAFLGLGLFLSLVLTSTASGAHALTAEELAPPEWRGLVQAPVDWMQVVDVETGEPPLTVSGVGVLEPGRTIEMRVKFAFHDVPSSFAQLHVHLLQIVDGAGASVRAPLVRLGTPSLDNREAWVRYRVGEAPGGFVLAFTSDAAADQPAYGIAAYPFAVSATPDAPVPDMAALQPPQIAAAPPPPAPVAPAPAAPPPVEQPAPVEPSAAQQMAPPAAPPAGVAAPVPDTTPGPETIAAAPELVADDAPAWLLPTLLGVIGVLVGGVLVVRVIRVAQYRASTRRLSNRP